MTREQINLLKRIQELQFTAIELTLYLDTHPDEKEPLMEYNRISQQFNNLKRTYEDRYGPLMVFGQSPSQYPWQWVNSPWPWEIDY
jgi:spore coat protein JB